MKNLLFILPVPFFVSLPAFSEQCKEVEWRKTTNEISTKVPEALKGAAIVVMRESGEAYIFSAEEYKVVPRKRQVVVTRVDQICRMNQGKLNRVSVLGGQGPTGHLHTTRNGGDAEVEGQVGLTLGAQYLRQLNDTVSAGVQVQDNKTVLSVIGFDF